MAIIKIVFDTQKESLMDVIERLDVQMSPLVSVTPGPVQLVEDLCENHGRADCDSCNVPPPPPAADIDPDILAEAKEELGNGSPSILLDEDGVPWDERIHSGNKKTAAKTGKWMKRRGIDQDIYDEVTKELKAAVDIPAPPPVPDAPPPPPPPGPAGQWDWNTLVKTLTKARAEGVTTKEQEAEVLQELGITLFPLLSPRTELYDTFCNKLGLVHP